MVDEKLVVGGETPPAVPPVTGDGVKGETPSKDKPAGRDAFQSLQEENARRRKENQELAARLKQFEDAQLSETDRQAKQAQEALARAERAEAALRRETALNAVRDVATELGLNARLAARLLVDYDWDYDENGRPRMVMSTVKKLVEEFPEVAGGAAETTTHTRREGAPAPLTAARRPQLTDPVLWEPK